MISSLLHLVGLRPRVYYTLTNFRGGGQGPLAPPQYANAKLEYYDITGRSYNILKNYLSNRSQYVEFNGHISNTLPISTGVPQGSILGPLLFLIYVNDLPLVSHIFDMSMYTDDTTLYCNINQNITAKTINRELKKLVNG